MCTSKISDTLAERANHAQFSCPKTLINCHRVVTEGSHGEQSIAGLTGRSSELSLSFQLASNSLPGRGSWDSSGLVLGGLQQANSPGQQAAEGGRSSDASWLQLRSGQEMETFSECDCRLGRQPFGARRLEIPDNISFAASPTVECAVSGSTSSSRRRPGRRAAR